MIANPSTVAERMVKAHPPNGRMSPAMGTRVYGILVLSDIPPAGRRVYSHPKGVDPANATPEEVGTVRTGGGSKAGEP